MKTTNLVKQEHIEEVSDQTKKKSDLLMDYFLTGFFIIGLLVAFYYDTWLIATGVGGVSLVAYYTSKFINLPQTN